MTWNFLHCLNSNSPLICSNICGFSCTNKMIFFTIASWKILHKKLNHFFSILESWIICHNFIAKLLFATKWWHYHIQAPHRTKLSWSQILWLTSSFHKMWIYICTVLGNCLNIIPRLLSQLFLDGVWVYP